MDAFKEKAIATCLVAGVLITACSGILTYVFAMGGVFRGTYTREAGTNRITDAGSMNFVPLMLVFVVLGLVLIAGSIGYGLWLNANQHKGPREAIQNVQVLGRYAFNRDGQMLTVDDNLDLADSPRFYVKLQLDSYRCVEFECSPATFWRAGEGMWGEAEAQGRWLGKFTPYVGGILDKR